MTVDLVLQGINITIRAIIGNSHLIIDQLSLKLGNLIYFIIFRVISTCITLDLIGVYINFVIEKGILSDLINLLSYGGCGSAEAIDDLWLKLLEHHLLTMLVH